MSLTKVQTIGIETGISFTGVTTITSLNATQGANISISSPGVALTITQSGTGGYVQVGTSSTVAVIDNSGRFLVGVASTTSDSRAVFQGSSASATGGTNVYFQRGSTPASGDKLGLFAFADVHGKVGAEISAYADATWSLGDYPGRLVFSTTPDGSSTVTERLRIDDNGNLILDSDLDTYIHHPAADTLAVTTGGSERVRIDSSGRFGLGTSSPNNTLHIASSNPIIRLQDTDGGRVMISCPDGHLDFEADSDNVIANSRVSFKIDDTERARIDSSGRLLVGTSSARTAWDNTTIGSNLLQVERAVDGGNTSISICANAGTSSPTDTGAFLYLGKTRGTTVGSTTAVASTDCLGRVSFQGSDGTEQVEAARVEAFVDGTPGTNDMPGRLVFATTADGASTPTERMRLDSSGRLGLGTTNPSNKLEVVGTSYFTDWIYTGSSSGSRGISSDSSIRSLLFGVNGGEVGRFDTSGRLLVGTSTSRTSSYGFNLEIEATSVAAGIAVTRNSNDASGSLLALSKSRSTTVGGNALVSSGDNLGKISFIGSDGTNPLVAASIETQVDGTPGANDMPGRLVFSTTADGASTPTERMRINNAGTTLLGNTADTTGVLGTGLKVKSNEVGSSFNAAALCLQGTGGDFYAVKFADQDMGILSVTSGATDAIQIGGSATTATLFSNGLVQLPNVGTTASAANVFMNSAAGNQLARSTSSLRYKTDIEDLDTDRADAALSLRPVWYRSKATADRKDWSHYGLIAEEVAEIEPRLVNWTYLEDDYITVTNEYGIENKELKPDAELVPDGVQYDRLPVLLLNVVQRQENRIKQLEAEIAALKAQ